MRYCVFAGSNTGRDEYVQAAVQLGRILAANGIGVVFGGASVGLMGVMADAVRAHDGEIIGVIPKSLVDQEVAHVGLADLRIVETMHQRKVLMSELSDGFIALPGVVVISPRPNVLRASAPLPIHHGDNSTPDCPPRHDCKSGTIVRQTRCDPYARAEALLLALLKAPDPSTVPSIFEDRCGPYGVKGWLCFALLSPISAWPAPLNRYQSE